KDLDADASVYIKDHQSYENHAELEQALKQQNEVLARLVETHNKEHKDDNIPFPFDRRNTTGRKVVSRARGILRVVRRTRNTYRDNLRQGLVRARNHLLILIALTGVTTYVLLCIAMLLDHPNHPNRDAFMAATAFYLVAAVA